MTPATYIDIKDLPEYPPTGTRWQRIREECLDIPPGKALEIERTNKTQSVHALQTNLAALLQGFSYLRATKRGDQVFVMNTKEKEEA